MNTQLKSLTTALFFATGLVAPALAQTAAIPAQQAKTFEQKITTTAKLNYL